MSSITNEGKSKTGNKWNIKTQCTTERLIPHFITIVRVYKNNLFVQ